MPFVTGRVDFFFALDVAAAVALLGDTPAAAAALLGDTPLFDYPDLVPVGKEVAARALATFDLAAVGAFFPAAAFPC